MAIYKRYNTRKKRLNRGLLIWCLCILAVFAVTAIIGYTLGQRAEGVEGHLPAESIRPTDAETIAPLTERVMRAEYVEPSKLSAFRNDDPFVYASTWIYRNGEATFATAVGAGLGKDVKKLPSADAFNIEAGTSGLFEVRSVYADENVREILSAYEKALLAEYAASGLSEIVLVFSRMDASCMDAAFALADTLPHGAVLCVPYALLKDAFAARFFSEATTRGYTLALQADTTTAETFATDMEDYAFSFTRYQLRLVLTGEQAALLDAMREKNLLSYQFTSPKKD